MIFLKYLDQVLVLLSISVVELSVKKEEGLEILQNSHKAHSSFAGDSTSMKQTAECLELLYCLFSVAVVTIRQVYRILDSAVIFKKKI